jgi:hypothetical protein
MKLIAWKSENQFGSCNARCYNSKKLLGKRQSKCICQGCNRGVGYEQAVKNTQYHYREWIKTRQDLLGTKISYELATVCQYIQISLW